MGTTLQQILGGRQLTGTIQMIKSGLPDVLPPGMFNVTERVEGNTCTYRRVRTTRQPARFTTYGAPGRKRSTSDVGEPPVKLLHAKHDIDFAASTLVNIESTDGVKQRLGGKGGA